MAAQDVKYPVGITIHSGEKLANKEGLMGKSDPYCQIHGYKVKTNVVDNSLNPTWEKSFDINLQAPNDGIVFRIYDKNAIQGDKLMGFAILPTLHFEKDSVIENFKLAVQSTLATKVTEGS